MTEVLDGQPLEDDASARAREEAQRRIEEILGESPESDKRPRRTRTILAVVLILLLLLLCGLGAFLFRMLSPKSSADEDTNLAGITWIRSIYGYGPGEAQQFNNPNDTATDPDGLIWVTDPGNAQVVAFRGDGTYVKRVIGSKQTGKPFRLPARVAFDSDGIMYLVDKASEELVIMDGQRKLVSSSIPGLSAVDVNDTMVVVGSAAGFAILDKDGNVKTIIGTNGTGDDQFDSVGGVAIDSATRTIYVVDTYNNRLSSWDYSGKRKWIVKLGNPSNDTKLQGGASIVSTSSAPSQLQLPTDVTIDANGRPMILDAFDFSLSAFDPKNGKFIDKWGTFGDKDGQFMYPTGFSYDAAKDWVVVADTQNERAQIIRVEGTSAGGIGGALSGLSRLMAGPARALWPCLILVPLIIIFLVVRRWRDRRAEQAAEKAAETDGEDAGSGDVESDESTSDEDIKEL